MILSKKELDDIATSIWEDYQREVGAEIPVPFIEPLAKQYLGLDIVYFKLSDDGFFYGLTAYEDTQLVLSVGGRTAIYPIKRNQIVLDSQFRGKRIYSEGYGKRQFTLAHEVAHQILYGMEPANVKASFRKAYSARMAHTPRELKTHEDWNEWQANVLGAALLMPRMAVAQFMAQRHKTSVMVCYDGIFNTIDRHILDAFCFQFTVSMSAACIRLKELGYLIDRPYREFYDPLEVFPDE